MESKEQTFNGQQMKGKKIKEVGQNSAKLLLLKEDKVDSGFYQKLPIVPIFSCPTQKSNILNNICSYIFSHIHNYT